jgi:hypothetical protein
MQTVMLRQLSLCCLDAAAKQPVPSRSVPMCALGFLLLLYLLLKHMLQQTLNCGAAWPEGPTVLSSSCTIVQLFWHHARLQQLAAQLCGCGRIWRVKVPFH